MPAPIPGHGIGNYPWTRRVLGKGEAFKRSGQSSAGIILLNHKVICSNSCRVKADARPPC